MTIIFSIFGETSLATSLKTSSNAIQGELSWRNFPDEESYIKIITNVTDQKVIFVASLDRPNPKLLPLLFTAATARELGAKSIGLIAPYLAYMRQDKRFSPGEAVTSRYFGSLLSNYFDWVTVVDPHLHRRKSLDEIFTIPTRVVPAINPIAKWIKQNIQNPLLIGPDSESKQLIIPLADQLKVPYVIAEKQRLSDRQVQVSMPELTHYKNYSPVVVDDIISTAQTMIATIQHLQKSGLPSPVCIGIHAVFTGDSYAELLKCNPTQVISCNTIVHVTNGIDLGEEVMLALQELS